MILRHCTTYLFLSTLSLRRATHQAWSGNQQPADFYPRSPCGERHFTPPVLRCLKWISIHALLAESDKRAENHASSQQEFLSTLSLRRATHYDNYNLHCVEISIHALLAESDGCQRPCEHPTRDFYPRSPCGERPSNQPERQARYDFYPRSPCGERHTTNFTHNAQAIFLSTLSLRRATSAEFQFRGIFDRYFYPRSPCGERPTL